MGVAVTRNQISSAVINENFNKVSAGSWEITKNLRQSEALIERIIEAVRSQSMHRKCVAVGVAIPALIHRDEGRIVYAPDFPGIEGINVQRKISDALDKAVLLDSLGNAKLAGESLQGAAAGKKNVIGLYLGDQVWGGMLIDGHLWRGSLGFAGQIGQVIVNPAGSRCGWSGVQGALDVYASGDGLRNQCTAHPVPSVNSKSQDIFLELTNAAEGGVAAASGHLQEMGRSLGQAIASAVNFTEITDILVSGPGKVALGWFEESLRDELDRSCMDALVPHISLLRSALGSDAALIGAAYNWQLQPHD